MDGADHRNGGARLMVLAWITSVIEHGGMPMSLLCLGVALLLSPGARARHRVRGDSRRLRFAPRIRRSRAFAGAERQCDPVDLAAGWDLLAASLRAGLALPTTLHAVAAELRGPPARILRETARATALGADAATAWEPALAHPDTVELARAAKRTARSGGGLAETAAGAAQRAREAAGEHAQVRTQRASVWVAAPLGLCFLPAFLCLGVLPVVVGMVDKLTASW